MMGVRAVVALALLLSILAAPAVVAAPVET
jgi:hypothetical protein